MSKNKRGRIRFDPDAIMLAVLIFVFLAVGIFAMTEIGSLIWNAITGIRQADTAQDEPAQDEPAQDEPAQDEPDQDEPAEGVAGAQSAARYLSGAEEEEVDSRPALEIYVEGEGPAPAWYDPTEPMAAEWIETERADIGCPDWNLDSTLYGAHGLTAEPWELDLMARIVSREVCGCSGTCWEAVADSILRRVESGHWGSTIYSVLSAVEDNGSWAYDTWPDVWDGEIELYDEIRAVCEERFYNGAEWDATHFRMEYYHPWAISLYEIDGVYFSLSPYLIGGVAG